MEGAADIAPAPPHKQQQQWRKVTAGGAAVVVEILLPGGGRTRTFPPPQQQQAGSSTAADGGVGGGGGSGSGSSACNTSDSGDDSGGSSPTPHDNSSSSSSSHSTPHSSSSSSTPCFTCLSGACSITNDVGVEKEYVLVGCNNSSCNEGDRMHYECFVQFEDAVLKFMRKTGRARSWSEEQRCSNLWTDKGYGLVKKVCKCRCGRGFLRPDLAHHQSAAAAAASAAASAATQATQSQRKGSGRRSRGKGKGRASVTSGGSPPPQLSGSAATRAAFAVGLPADAIADIAAPFSASSSSSSSSSSGGGGGAVTATFPQAVGTGSPVGSWSPQQPSAAFLSQHQHQHQHPHHTHAQQQQQHRTTHPFQQQNDGHHRQGHRRESAPGTSPLWGDGGGGGSAAAVFADAVVAVAAPQARAVLPFNDLAPSLAAPDWATSPTKAGGIGIGIGIAIGSSVDGGDAEGDVVMHDLQDTSWLEEDRAPPQRRWSMPGFFSDGVGGPADEAATATYRMHSADLSWAGHPHQHGQQQHQHGQQQQQQQQHQGPHLPWGNDGSSGAARQDTDGMQGGGGSWTSATGSVSANNSPARHWVQPIVPTTTTATAATAAAAAAAIDHTTSPMEQRWSSGWADAGDSPRLVV